MSRPNLALVATALIAVISMAACQQSPGGKRGEERTPSGLPPSSTTSPASSASQAPTRIPANISHGEAPVGTAADSAPVDPVVPPRSTDRLHRVRFEIVDTIIAVAPSVQYRAWTFQSRVPGPVVRVTQGDEIEFTLVNRGSIAHSMDFHAAQIAPSKYYVNILPGDSIHYRFTAEVAGAFMYHCGTAPVAAHIANGMYGALIVDPPGLRRAAKELVFVQSEFYMTANPTGPRSLAWDRLLGLAPDYVTFNGRAAQYATHPIRVKVNDLVRIYLVNAGPNRFSSFHVVGGIFERVFVDGSQRSPLEGVQTVAVPVGGGSIFEIRLKQPGEYPFVTHAFADATKGAVGVLLAE
ncbi:MAG: multicopper oxidase domain-containing protein [Gemmatimonadaceae bacterium]|nr:multicopper oxidase domain-containing protein [Gemmatimonadaceae bacterium]